MTESPSPLRNHIISFFLRLCKSSGVDIDDPSDRGPLRHLAIAGLTTGQELSPETLLAATRALPWLAIALQWEEGDPPEAVIESIQRADLLHQIGPEALRRRLSTPRMGQGSAIRRTPTGGDGDDSKREERAVVLTRIADHDRRLNNLADQSPASRLDALLDDAGLLAAALDVEAARSATDRDSTDSFRGSLRPQWALDVPAQSLEILARFEEKDFQDIPFEWRLLSDRSQRFEQSLAQHLNRHDLIRPIRAALAFAPAPHSPAVNPSEMRRFLTRFTALADDPPALALTMALIELRHRSLEHLRGALPLNGLRPWIAYLRGPCSDFAESRGITLREATNFAHYALHLINLCDLSALDEVSLSDPLRRAMMDVEDELKEFALVGQSQGLSDEESDLHRYEQTRWRTQGTRALLADRIARLSGAWTQGHRAGPPGSPPRPDHDLSQQCMALLRDADSTTDIDATANLMRRAQLECHDWLQALAPRDILDLLSLATTAARQSSSIDTDQPYRLDFSALRRWLKSDNLQRRTDIVRTLVHLSESGKLTNSALLDNSIGLVTDAANQSLSIDFSTTDELDALLTLVAQTESDDPSLTKSLLNRLSHILQSETDHTSSPQDDERRPPQPPST